MTVSHAPTAHARHRLIPKLFSILAQGYSLAAFRKDAVAGLTVAIVALPLSMAIAIASHASPDKGLYTAIIGGFFISLFGGSRFQIGGPAGAFIVLLASITDRAGFDGLLLVTLMAGVILMIVGFLRLGSYIKYVPHPVTVGFTTGIAVIILVSQLKDLLGLQLSGPEPAALIPKLETLGLALPGINLQSALLAGLVVVLIVVLRKFKPHWPGFLIAVAIAAFLSWALHLNVETISSRFGGIPQGLPLPQLPAFSLQKAITLLPDALTVALLGGIESLLSAVVADSMSGGRHRSNMELVAQGMANIACSLFGGITATGTIARTATNVRSGACSPVSGILHSGYILLFMLVAAPLAGYVPLCALAALLVVVAWNMAEKAEFRNLLTSSKGDAAVLLATFLLVVLVDLPTGIVVGVVMGSLLFMHRMAEDMQVEAQHHALSAKPNSGKGPYDFKAPEGVIIYRMKGAFFFGAASTVAATLDVISEPPRSYIIDFSQVPFVDSTAIHALHGFVAQAAKHAVPVYFTGVRPATLRHLEKAGLDAAQVRYKASIEHAIADFGGEWEINHIQR